ncbi:MAG: hypothetical protein PHU80_03015 [Kiritimatiellae bacterium]|nr:hypothetical protein [Kiritimatiellia bacterium]
MKKHNYLDTLGELGKEHLRIGKTVVLPFGGRVIGLFPQPDLNALWVNPALYSKTSASALLKSGWANLGGDRTWLSPEIEVFVSDAAQPAETYRVPRALDPADYRVTGLCGDTVELKTSLEVNLFRSGCIGRFSLVKRMTDLGMWGAPLPQDVTAAGYEMVCVLTVEGLLPAAARPALWNLLQVPGGGDIIVPVKGTASPVAYFGSQQWRKDGQKIVLSVPAIAESYKSGVMAESCYGAAVYLNGQVPQPFMILRRFTVGCGECYFDAPFNAPHLKGVVQQVYVDHGELGGFGEMEHHSPALLPDGECVIQDRCTTWAFAGPAERLKELAETVLAQNKG